MFSIKLRENLFTVIDCFEENFNMAFGELRFLLMFNKSELNNTETDMLIDIFKNALANSKLKMKEGAWIEKNFYYFKGNCGSNNRWSVKFENKDFTFDELTDYVEQIKEIKEYDFLLRVPEVILRDDVEFTKDIQVLKNTYISILNDVINGKGR